MCVLQRELWGWCEEWTLDGKPRDRRPAWRVLDYSGERWSDLELQCGNGNGNGEKQKNLRNICSSPWKSVVLLLYCQWTEAYWMSQNYILSTIFAHKLKYFHNLYLQMYSVLFSDTMCTRNGGKIVFINWILWEKVWFSVKFISDGLNGQWTTQTNLLDRSW